MRLPLVGLIWLLAAGTVLSAGAQSPPTLQEVLVLLRQLNDPGAGKAKEARAKLRTWVHRYPEKCKEILSELRSSQRKLSRILGAEGGDGNESFLQEKLGEAFQAYKARRYAEAQALCEAILTLGAEGAVRVRARRLARLAADRTFADRTLLVDLKAEREVVPYNAPICLTLEIVNRSEWEVDLTWAPPGLLGQLDLGVTTITAHGQVWGTRVTQELKAHERLVHLGPGESWQQGLEVEPGEQTAGILIERITVRGRLIPTTIRLAGRLQTRQLRVPMVVVLRVPPKEVDLAADPLAQLRGGITSGRPERVFLGAVLCVWEGEFESAVRALLEGTASSSGPVRDSCYTTLRLITGRNFGMDRKRWIRFFLSHEKLPVGGPLAEW